MTIPVTAGTTTVFCGDSLTAEGWFSDVESAVGGTNLLVDQLSSVTVQQWPGIVTNGALVSSATGEIGSNVAVPGGGQINAINSGHGQKQIGDCLANINSWILDFFPEVLVLEFGRNDVAPPLPPFTPTTLISFRASYDAVLDQTLAMFPDCKFVCLSILCDGELWLPGPVWNNFFDPGTAEPGYTPSIVEFNQQIQESCIAHGGIYIDLRTPLLAFEVANNPQPSTATGIATIDGTHPNASGQLLMSDEVRPSFVFVP